MRIFGLWGVVKVVELVSFRCVTFFYYTSSRRFACDLAAPTVAKGDEKGSYLKLYISSTVKWLKLGLASAHKRKAIVLTK